MKRKQVEVTGIYINVERVPGKDNKVTQLRGKTGEVVAEAVDRVLVNIEGKEYSLPRDVVTYID